MKNMLDLSYEFIVFTDIPGERVVPIYRELDEEEIESFRQEHPDCPLIPKRVKVDERVEQYTMKSDALFRRRVPDITKLVISQAFDRSGKLYSKRFVIEEGERSHYLVKGNYYEFKDKLDSINKKHKIGYV